MTSIDQISAKFLKDYALVIAIHLANIISLSIKFLRNLKQQKHNFCLKRELRLKVKNWRFNSTLLLISKLIKN